MQRFKVLSDPGNYSILSNGMPNGISIEISEIYLVSLYTKLWVIQDQNSIEWIPWRKLVSKSRAIIWWLKHNSFLIINLTIKILFYFFFIWQQSTKWTDVRVKQTLSSTKNGFNSKWFNKYYSLLNHYIRCKSSQISSKSRIFDFLVKFCRLA